MASASLFSNLSDAELRSELQKNGENVGPVTPSTRKVYEIKLLKIAQKSSNIDEFMENLSFTVEQNNLRSTPEPTSNTPTATNGTSTSATKNGVGSRNGSPVVSNNSKHQGGSSAQSTPISAREKKLLLNNTSDVFVAVQKSPTFGLLEGKETMVEQPKQNENDHNSSSSDDDANESARILTPEEVARFRSNFSSSRNTTDELDLAGISRPSTSFYSPKSYGGNGSNVVAKPKKGGILAVPASSSVMFASLAAIVAFAMWVIFKVNLNHFDTVPGQAFKDEI